MNWGKGIIIGMGAFMTFIIVMGVYMFKSSTGDYDRQYYEKGLAYDSVYVKEKQVITDKAQPRISLEKDMMYITFAAIANGTARFERPSDPTLDKVVAFKTYDLNEIAIPLEKFTQGQWQVTFEWKSSGKKYLYQREMYLR